MPCTACLEGKKPQLNASCSYTTVSKKLNTACFKTNNLSNFKWSQLFPVQKSGNVSIVPVFDLSLLLLLLQDSPVS